MSDAPSAAPAAVPPTGLEPAPSAALPLGDLRVFDHVLPVLPDGSYTVTLAQTVSAATQAIPDRTQSFTVRGPRFVLDPGEVHAQFPPADASGRFGENLPHLVFNKRALPWERRLSGLPEGTPWMALLAFDEGELRGEPGDAGHYARAGKVRDLLRQDDRVRVPDPRGVSEAEEGLDCRWIEVDAGVFRRVVPRGAELPWLGHARQVNTADKAALGMMDEGWFSVLIGSRLPAEPEPGGPAARTVVHLVSLEGLEPLLAEGAPFPRGSDGKEQAVRMVSLFAWSFQTLADPSGSFRALAAGVAAPGTADPQALMLRLAAPPALPGDTRPAAVQAAERRLREGYVAVDYQARTGDHAFAWYRGPLAPAVIPPLEKDGPFASAGAAAAWDEATRTFDHSLAAAWTLGRALALADADFTLRLMNVHRRGHRVTDQVMARLQSVHLATPEDVAGLAGGDPFRARVAELLSTGVTESIATAATADPAEAAPSADEGESATARRAFAAPPPAAPAEGLRGFMARDDVQALVREEVGKELAPVGRWLARLCLLQGVPFAHLVPDPRMLPPESLRFFYLDRTWVEAAVDGALSVGAHTGRDRLLQQALYDALRGLADAHAAAERAAARSVPGLPGDALPASLPEVVGGMLLRSALVSGWPGLAVRGYVGDVPLPVLRMERLSGSVLLCLWAGVPDRVELAEPQEGLRFGVEEGAIDLRSVAAPVGRPLDGASVPLKLREGRVLDLRPASGEGMLAALARGLGRTQPAPTFADPRISPAELAVQMVRAPARLTLPPLSRP